VLTQREAEVEEKSYVFRVTFRPKRGWVDEVYLGNMLIELLGSWSRQTLAFEFSVEYVSGQKNP